MKSGNHIVFLTPGFAANEGDTTCIPPLYLLVDELSKQQPSVQLSVIAFQYPFQEKIYKRGNATIYALGGKNKRFPYRLWLWWKVFHCFSKINKANRVSVIHSFWLTECTFIGGALSKWFSCKLFSTIMGQDARKDNRYISLVKLFKPEVIACSSYAIDYARQARVKVSHNIPFGIDNNASEWKRTSNRHEFDLAGIGNFGYGKNYKLFTEIFLKVKKQIPELNAVLIGKGQEEQLIKELLKENDSLNSVLMPGHLPRHEVMNYLLRSRIFLHTSSYEGQGYVYLEALACGLESVSFNVGYLPESAKVHICTSSEEMVDTIIRLLKQPADYTPVISDTIGETATKYYILYKSYIN